MQDLITTKDYATAVSAATRWATKDLDGRAYIFYSGTLGDYRVTSSAAFSEWYKNKVRVLVAIVDAECGYIDASRVARAKSFQQITSQMDDQAIMGIIDTLPVIVRHGHSWGTTAPLGGIGERFWSWTQSVFGVFVGLAVAQCLLVLFVIDTISAGTLSFGVRFLVTLMLLLPMMLFGIIVDSSNKDKKKP